MESHNFSRLVMLGATPQTRGSMASVVEAYRLQGLFRRWPVDYLAIQGDAPGLESLALAAAAARRLAGLVARHRRVVLHVHCSAREGFWRALAFASAGCLAGCPLILQLHGGGFETRADAAGARAALRALFERAGCVIVPSESLRAWTRSVTRTARVACIPYPVALPAHVAAQAERSPLVLFLGRLEQAKGIFDLLEAIAAVRAEVPGLRLVCAGEGDRAAVSRYAERLGLGGAVKFTGWVGPSGKRALLESASVFALPSYREGMPASLLEAMAAGLPSIASQVGGIPEAIVDGVSGFLVGPGDTAALARALRKLLADRPLAARIGAAARESARLRFAPERCIARLEELYADAGLMAPGDSRRATAAMREAA